MSGVHRALHGLTHSFPTRRSSDLPYLVLQAGLFGTINIPGSLLYRGVLIPDNAIAADQNRRIVYVVDDAGKVSARQVRPGPRLHGYRVVREGLQGDETIVINGLMSVRPGVVVTPNLVELPQTAADTGSGTRDRSEGNTSEL